MHITAPCSTRSGSPHNGVHFLGSTTLYGEDRAVVATTESTLSQLCSVNVTAVIPYALLTLHCNNAIFILTILVVI